MSLGHDSMSDIENRFNGHSQMNDNFMQLHQVPEVPTQLPAIEQPSMMK